MPEEIEIPSSRPDAPATKAPDQTVLQSTAEKMPAEEAACRRRLLATGTVFKEHEPLSDASGCSAPWPLTVTRLPGDVDLRPEAVMTCAMAEATADFVTDHAEPLAREVFEEGIAAVNQVSAYVCRPRAGTSTLSEHAFANALDWGSVELTDGTTIAVRHYRRSEPRRARLMAELRKAACGPFKTVLGPGTDADHADHFHFDMAERRNGGTWCR
ncbi:extensin family protein [Mesorhizobium sp. CAU 1741]|uniref:extensin-like domain-containing protein n=1 Tax=Mesorhizobium sp. CAU 1741 TaxID=3140366 RepID=UPI00325B8231